MKHDSFFLFHSTLYVVFGFFFTSIIYELTHFSIYIQKRSVPMHICQDIRAWRYIHNRDNDVSFMEENQRKSIMVLCLYIPCHDHSPSSEAPSSELQWYFGKIIKCTIHTSMHDTSCQCDNVQRREPGLSYVGLIPGKQHENLC